MEEYRKPEIADLIFMLSTTALHGMGLIPDPLTQKTKKDLAAAQWSIDLLAELQKKTEGNLTEEEETVFKDVLFNLRMQYIEALNQPADEEKPKEEAKEAEQQ